METRNTVLTTISSPLMPWAWCLPVDTWLWLGGVPGQEGGLGQHSALPLHTRLLQPTRAPISSGKQNLAKNQCCGSGMFIPEPNFSILDPEPKVKKILDPESGSASKNLSILTQKIALSSRKYDPGCSIWILIFYPSRIQGSKRHRIPDTNPQHCKKNH
jgi:hypothetical protein